MVDQISLALLQLVYFSSVVPLRVRIQRHVDKDSKQTSRQWRQLM